VGTLYGDDTEAEAINNQGMIAGHAFSSQLGDHAFRTGPQLPINPVTDDLGAIGHNRSEAFGINYSGQSTGWVETSHGITSAARFPATGANVAPNSLIGTYGGTLAIGWDINDSGQVVGYSRSSGQSVDRAFRTRPNAPINKATDDLGTLGGNESRAFGINNSGQVTGAAHVSGFIFHAFRTKPNQPINRLTDDLGLPGFYSSGDDINDAGWVVGSSNFPNAPQSAFLCPPDRPISPTTDNLGVLPGYDASEALALNNYQVVVGKLTDVTNQTTRAFVYDGIAMYNLADLVEPTSRAGWVLNEAVDINDFGQIVGNGTFNGMTQPFLLTLIPEPSCSTLVIVAVGGAAFIANRRR
jgi:probable HAF family extracellular repeat protein